MEFKFKKRDWKIAIISIVVAAIVVVMIRTPLMTQASEKVMDVLSSISGDVSGDISGDVSGNASGICGDDLEWTLEDGTLTVSGSGDMYDYYDEDIPWADYQEYIKNIVIEKDVTSIGSYAFAITENLISVNFEEGSQLEIIGEGAFDSCEALESIIIPEGVTDIGDAAFYDCDALVDITIPNSVTYIGDYAFYDCNSLKEVIIPKGVTYVGEQAFGIVCDDEGDEFTDPEFVITGCLGSKAESYASKNDISFVKNGVVNPKKIKITKTSFKYTGKKITPKVKVVNAVGNTISSKYYSVKYTSNVKAGTAKITVTFTKDYKNCKALTKTFKINKINNPMKLKTSSKKFSLKTLKKKSLSCQIKLKSKAQGKVKYILSKSAKKAKIKVNSKGKVTVPKKCKKGVYKITVKAAGNRNYKSVSRTFKVIVK